MASVRMFTKGCGLMLALWLVPSAAYTYVAWHTTFEVAPTAVVGLLGGTFTWMLLSTIVGFFTSGRDRAAIRRAANMEPRKDGRLEAASGPIRPLEQPLEAPFTGQPCVAYEYDVKRAGQGQSDYAGYAMAPCAVQTLSGPAKLLGFVTLDQFPMAREDRIDRARGAAYLSSAAFDSLGVTSILSAFSSLIADDDGTIHKDFKIAGEGGDLQGRSIVERSVAAGTTVTLLGYWSESRGGFTAGPGSLTRLYNADLASTRKRLGGDSVQMFFIALVFWGILHGILVPAYYLGGPKIAAGRGESGSVWDERDCDKQKKKLGWGADPNEVGEDAITALMNAARMDETACVTNLIAAGAHLEARDKWGDTALVHAVTAERYENAAALLKAGAQEFRVTSATGRPVTPDAAPLAAIQAYIDAVHRGDFETMAHLLAHASARRMEDHKEDLPGWQALRPKTFTVDEGWMTDTAATITIRGRTASGEQRAVYQLEWQTESGTAEKTGGGFWQIRKEWLLEH